MEDTRNGVNRVVLSSISACCKGRGDKLATQKLRKDKNVVLIELICYVYHVRIYKRSNFVYSSNLPKEFDLTTTFIYDLKMKNGSVDEQRDDDVSSLITLQVVQ